MRWNLRTSVRWWHVLATFLLFMFIGWQSALQSIGLVQSTSNVSSANVWDAVFIAGAGPGLSDTSLLRMLVWFLPHLLFFYAVGNFAHEELRQRGYTVVPLVGSRLWWWWGKVVTLGLLAVAYVVLGLGAIFAGAMIVLPWSWEGSVLANSGLLFSLPHLVSGGMLLSWLFWLLGSTLFMLVTWQTTLALVLQHSFRSFAAISAITLISWLLGTDSAVLVRWLPGSQSILLRHTFFDPSVPNLSLQWSVGYIASLTLGAICVGAWHVSHMDIFGKRT